MIRGEGKGRGEREREGKVREGKEKVKKKDTKEEVRGQNLSNKLAMGLAVDSIKV